MDENIDDDEVEFYPDQYKCSYYEENHILRDPVVCKHCSKHFCTQCLKNGKCPSCPKDKEKNIERDNMASDVIKKCFDNWTCDFCQERYGNKSEKEHKDNCSNVTFQCSICNYFWTDDETKFWMHLKNYHDDEVIKQLDIGKKI